MIDKMVPSASFVDVDIKVGSNPYYQITRESLNSALHRLFSSAKRRHLKVRPGALYSIVKPTTIQGLTSIYAVEIGKFEQLALLLHRNAPTLQTLHLSFFSTGRIGGMIYNGKHEVEYPALQKLVIHWPPAIILPLNQPKTSKPLFPVLCYLNVGGLYPFADNVLFRGNDRTLRYLSINAASMPSDLHAEFAMLIQKKASLRFLKIANSHLLDDVARYLPSSLQTLKLGQISDLSSSQEGFFPAKLVNLTIGAPLAILEITQLLKALPNLSYLSSGALQPTVISEILGGIILGPTALGRWQAFTDNVFPEESIANLNLVANFGLVLFLFMVGLELDPRMLKRNVRRGITISAAGIILPFSLGVAVSYALFSILMDREGSYVNFLLFCGVAMSITAFPVLARILTERNLLKTTVGSISMSAAAVDDVVSWCLLALVIALTNNSSGLTALWVFLAGLGWVLLVIFIVRPIYLKYLRHSGVFNGREPQQMVLFITFMMVLISAFFTDAIGIHAIFGGFLVGAIIPHDGGFAVKVIEKIEDVVHIFFLPIYFTLSGLKTDFTDLKSGATWGLWVLVTLVAFLGKIVGCGLAARFIKFTWRESATIGVLMATKGLVELVVLNIGLDAGVIDTRIFSLMVLMAIVTTVSTTPLVTWLYPPKCQKRLEDQLQGDESKDSKDPNAGPPVNMLIVLNRIQQVPAAMALLSYFHRKPPSSSALSLGHLPFYRPIRVFGLRLLELTGRDSSIMKHYESELQILTDPAISMFRTLAQVVKLVFHGALNFSDYEHFADNIINSAQDAGAEITIVTAFGRRKSLLEGSVHKSSAQAGHLVPGWFESLGWGFSAEQQASFVIELFTKAQNHMCVFIDCGLAETEETAKADYNVASGVCSDDVIIEEGAPLAAESSDDQHVPVIVVPFFGGADDRQAVKLVSDLCTQTPVRVQVWRFTRFGARNSVVESASYSSIAKVHFSQQTMGGVAEPSNLAAETRVDEDSWRREMAERELDEQFLDSYLRPTTTSAEERAKRLSMATVDTAIEPPKATTSANPADSTEAADQHSSTRHKLASKLRLRQAQSPTQSSVLPVHSDDSHNAQVANVQIQTITTATPLQTFLQRARMLKSADLVVCGRSVRDSHQYFDHSQELAMIKATGNTQALGATAEYLLGSGTSASVLVVQSETTKSPTV
ncbi:K(+)/H(+) antiporter [Coemansia sp. RSA 989]|nr:K(+)/H(+) antiporter [Coemansia sp. RSA 989]KAJ1876220.1 K(+)/H(+) antiporter [Coemansia sp. RSA 990]